MKSIIVASKNKGKIKEFQQLFSQKGIQVSSLLDLNLEDDIAETGKTFEENAIIKAEAISNLYNQPVIADDSGLSIDALQGRPGVYSARYAGEHKSDEDNMDKVLHELKDIPFEDRSAQFICVLAVVAPGQKPVTFTGKCEGMIHTQKSGTKGFGYDPIFYVPSYQKTMAELSSNEKNKISHRGKAIKQLMARFDELF
jgi:XTP/dITP diphosphohydrolase